MSPSVLIIQTCLLCLQSKTKRYLNGSRAPKYVFWMPFGGNMKMHQIMADSGCCWKQFMSAPIHSGLFLELRSNSSHQYNLVGQKFRFWKSRPWRKVLETRKQNICGLPSMFKNCSQHPLEFVEFDDYCQKRFSELLFSTQTHSNFFPSKTKSKANQS